MASFFFVLLAGFVWLGLRGEFGLEDFLLGALLGFSFWRFEAARSRVSFTLGRLLRLGLASGKVAAIFVWELVAANLGQLRVVLAPRIDVKPRWVHFEIALESPALRALLGVMISLTPGSLVCDETAHEGAFHVWIHVLDTEDPDAVIERIRRRLEAPLRALETP